MSDDTNKPTPDPGRLDLTQRPEGPWSTEDHSFAFTITSRLYPQGYPALVQRHEHLGHLCGYLDVPGKHPWAQADTIHDLWHVDVHGGITLFAPLDHGARRLGFDCAHAFDLIPALAGVSGGTGDNYRSVRFVVDQLHYLATCADCAVGKASGPAR